MNTLDESRYVPANYPEIAALRNQGCPVTKPRNTRVDFTREFFCRKWGESFNCICPPRKKTYSTFTKPLKGVGKEMESYNYFSAPSLKIEGVDPTLISAISRAERKGMISKDQCPKARIVEYACPCPEREASGARAIKNVPVGGNDFQGFDISSDLPFRVCIGEYPSPGSTVIRTGVDRCLRPSLYQNFNSSYNENFIDFFKTKSPQELALYRTPLVIDHRRPRPTIPTDPNPGLVIGVNNGPVNVNARPIRWKPCGKPRPGTTCLVDNKPDFEICVSGPIVIPTDYEYDC